MKQVIVLRKDLKMRKGKMCAQAAHASLGAVLHRIKDIRVEEWLDTSQTKICVSCESEDELHQLHDMAKSRGLLTHVVTDLGKTEFNGVHTVTAIAIGPDTDAKINSITEHLKLL